MSSALRVFVTGGSGFVGSHLIPALVAAGHSVWALARSEASARRVEALGARRVWGELGAVHWEALDDIDVIVHAAAKAEDWGDPVLFDAINVTGTQQLLEAARSAGVKRFIHISTEAAVFRGRDLIDIDESVPLAPDSPFPYSASKAKAEQAVQAANSEALSTVVLRPRLIWGPGDSTVLPVVAQAAEDGTFAWTNQGAQQISTTHVHNLVDAILAALHRGPGGTVAFVVDAETHTMRDFLTAYAEAAGIELPTRSVPGWLLRTAASVLAWGWTAFDLDGRPPITPFAASLLSSHITIRSTAAEEAMGWRPPIGFKEGLSRVSAA